MEKLSHIFVAVKGLLGMNSAKEIAERRAADLQEISEKFLEGYSRILESFSRRGYKGPPATIENINEIYIPLRCPESLVLETNRSVNGVYIVVNIDFMRSAWGSASRLTRAVDALDFNIVSTVEENPHLLGLNPRNFVLTETKKKTGPGQKIYEAAWGRKIPMNVVIVRAEHEWLSEPVAPSEPCQSQSERAVAEMEATLQ